MHSASDSTASDSSGSSDPAVSDSSASSSSQTPAQSGSQAPTLGKGREDRASWLEGCSKTFEYLTEVSKDKTLHFRQSDKITTRLLVASLIGSLIFAAFPFFEMKTLAA